MILRIHLILLFIFVSVNNATIFIKTNAIPGSVIKGVLKKRNNNKTESEVKDAHITENKVEISNTRILAVNHFNTNLRQSKSKSNHDKIEKLISKYNRKISRHNISRTVNTPLVNNYDNSRIHIKSKFGQQHNAQKMRNRKPKQKVDKHKIDEDKKKPKKRFKFVKNTKHHNQRQKKHKSGPIKTYDYNGYYRSGIEPNTCKKVGIILLPGLEPLVIDLNDSEEDTDYYEDHPDIYDEENEEYINNYQCKDKIYLIIIKPKARHFKRSLINALSKDKSTDHDKIKERVYISGEGDNSCQINDETGKVNEADKGCQVSNVKKGKDGNNDQSNTNYAKLNQKNEITTKTTKKPVFKPIDEKTTSELTSADLDVIASWSWEQ